MATAGKTITCRAAVLWEVNKPYSIENIEVAPPKKGEVRVKMASTGLCHSDLHIREGLFKSWPFPTVLGHEGAGFVESVGEGVTRLQVGDLVVCSFESYCRECDYCENPNTNMCRNQPRNHTQMDGTTRMTCKGKNLSQMCSLGTCAEYITTSRHNLAKVNPKADTRSLCLAGCCVPTGYGAAMNAAKVKPGSTCAVWGLGGIGMNVVLGCRDSGASRIIGIDVNPKKEQFAKEFGATDFLNPNEVESIPEALKELTGDGVDYCFVAVGFKDAMEEAFNSSHPHWGKTVIIGEIGGEMHAGIWELLYGRQLVGTYYGGYKAVRDIPYLVEKVVSGQIPLNKLITHRLPLEKINEGYELLVSGKALRAVVDYNLKI